MNDFEQEYYRTYPDLRTIFTCVGCGRGGTTHAYGSDTLKEPLIENGVALLDRSGNPRMVERHVFICKFCGGNQQTKTTR